MHTCEMTLVYHDDFQTTLLEQATKSVYTVAGCWCGWSWEKPVGEKEKWSDNQEGGYSPCKKYLHFINSMIQ